MDAIKSCAYVCIKHFKRMRKLSGLKNLQHNSGSYRSIKMY